MNDKPPLGLHKVAKEELKALVKECMESDCISRKELLQKWEETTPRGRTEFDQVIMTMPSVLPKAKWIPVSERLPEYKGEYLLFGKVYADDESNYIFIGDYDNDCEDFGNWQTQYNPDTLDCFKAEFYEYESILAWMPIPDPYEEVEK